VLLPSDQNLASSYTNFEIFDQFVPTPVTDCYYESPEIDISFDDAVRAWGDITSNLGPGETVGVADPHFELDYRLSAGSYDGFENWSVGLATGRYFKHRIHLQPADGKAVVTAFKPTVDSQEYTQRGANVSVSNTGTAVTYPIAFHTTAYIEITVISATALFPTLENVTTSGFTVHVFDATGTEVGTGSGESISWQATGV